MQEKDQINHKINSLVSAVKGNDTASFVELLGHFSRAITALAYSFSLPDSEYQDLCQEGRMALYRAAVSYDEKSASFSTYAITCMTNAMLSFSKKYIALNKGTVYGIDPELYESVAADPHNFQTDTFDLLSQEGFAGLSAYERKVMRYKLFGYKVSEIAKKLDKQPKSIENTLFRARKKLRAYIDG